MEFSQEPKDPKLAKLIEKLDQKYESMGQDMGSYLDGLLYSNYLHYWDYIHIDTLLSLQTPRTDFPDEMIFITYHQITELYFKLVLFELKQIGDNKDMSIEKLTIKVKRINRYFDNLVHSFEIMTDGMDRAEFLKFRMSLLPASGFQSAQFRLIEIYSTDLFNLVDKEYKPTLTNTETIEQLYELLYWKKGATELATDNKTLTLVHFEKRYTPRLIRHAHDMKTKNLNYIYLNLKNDNSDLSELEEQLKLYDKNVNFDWANIHLKAASRHLEKKPDVIAATGGTNWQKYLPPLKQLKTFFPNLTNIK